MIFYLLFLIFGFIVLVKGADFLVEGASALARRFGLSTFFIGLTIVAFGTSMPELVVSVLAGLKGSPGIALGNAIGSNISNTLLILGVSSLIAPLLVKKATISREIPFSLLAVSAFFALANDYSFDGNGFNILSRIDGFILILFFLIFIFYTFGISRQEEGLIEGAVDDLSAVRQERASISAARIIAGLAGLIIGGRFIVDSAAAIAKVFQVSEDLVGLTIVAIGTSLPELATSALAARRGKADIAIGNIIGSNIFNLFFVLGLSALIRPLEFDVRLNVDSAFLFLATILLLVLIYTGKKNILARREGLVLLVLYLFYIGIIMIRG